MIGNIAYIRADNGALFPFYPDGQNNWVGKPVNLNATEPEKPPTTDPGGNNGSNVPGAKEWQWPFQYSKYVFQTGPIAPLTQFGYRINPVTHTRLLHQGLDFGAGGINGMPIPSAHDGTVEVSASVAAPYFGYGAAILIRHPDGTACLYAHRPEKFLNVGDRVKRGQVIGRVGQSGRVTGPHLHWETWEKGNVKVDPRKFMRDRGIPET